MLRISGHPKTKEQFLMSLPGGKVHNKIIKSNQPGLFKNLSVFKN